MLLFMSALARSVPEDNFDDRTPRVMLATVIDSFAHTGTYIVRLPNGPTVPAVDAFDCPGLPLGARPIGQYAPRSRVLTYYHPDMQYVIIMGVVPRGVSSAKLVLPTSLTLRSDVGLTEPRHYSAFTVTNTNLPNHSVGRPIDSLPGDKGWINDLGVALYIGRMLASLKASDLAKVEAFYGDDLLRIVGYNLERFTASRHDYAYNDEGEYNEVDRLSPYPWEGMGVSGPTDSAAQELEGVLKPFGDNAPLEPNEPDQLIMPRLVRMRGYLGDIEKEWVVKPPADVSTEKYDNQSKYVGLLEITKAVTGAYSIRSAKEITLEKWLLIPVPKEMYAPEDAKGDNRTNYKAANVYGEGDTYEWPEYEWGEDTPNIRAAQLYEYHAYLFNAQLPASIVAHTLDWYLPNELELEELGASGIYDGGLDFGHQFMASLPTVGAITIDHRTNARYYRSRSVIKQLDDGSILIEDGYGSQIRMAGGNIFVTCAGDVWTQPGRSAVTWAPHDAIMRAGNAVDISASKSDVRIKAEKNLHMLSGNKGIGGLLLENRATVSATPADFAELGAGVIGHGITLKAVDSSFYAYADSIHIGRGQTSSGQLTLDAGSRGRLFLRGQNIDCYNLGVFSVMRSNTGGGASEMFILDQNTAIITVPTQMGGTVVVAPAGGQEEANIFVGGSVIAFGRGVFGDNVVTNKNFASRNESGTVGYIREDIDLSSVDPSGLSNNIRKNQAAVEERIDAINDAVTKSSDSSPGNDRFKARMGFSYRTTEDMRLNSTFLIYESRWQQILRVAGTETKWDEISVTAPDGSETFPHPGQEGWETFEAYGQINFENFNFAEGHSNPRDDLLSAGQEPVKGSLKDGYLINVQG
jgi:hypothetical protein